MSFKMLPRLSPAARSKTVRHGEVTNNPSSMGIKSLLVMLGRSCQTISGCRHGCFSVLQMCMGKERPLRGPAKWSRIIAMSLAVFERCPKSSCGEAHAAKSVGVSSRSRAAGGVRAYARADMLQRIVPISERYHRKPPELGSRRICTIEWPSP